jgi:predicted CXXCH cytochrome family protein
MSLRLWLLVAVSPWFLAPTLLASSLEYVDPTTCYSCHRELSVEYLKTPMGRSFYLPDPENVIEDWEAANKFYHSPSDQHYEMLRRGSDFFVRRYQLNKSGQPENLLERQVTHVMGSGTRARSYLHMTAEGRIIELPVAWYSQEKRWAMAPGYDRPNHPGFTRTVNHKCMFCHNAYPNVPAERARQGWDHDVRFPKQLPLGIACQRCHGPGGEHVRAANAAESVLRVRSSIVNPARLSPDRQLEICMQCHLETTTFRLPESYRRFGRGFYSYRPGEPLADYIVHFDHAPGTGHDDKFEIVSAAYRLRKAACFLKSEGKLTCTTCHNPHGTVAPGQRAKHYRDRCLSCHSSKDAAPHKLFVADFDRSDCVACHMPSRRTEDVVHVVMTDHWIQRTRPPRDLLAPLQEKTDEEQTYRGEVVWYYPGAGLEKSLKDVYLAIAQVKEKVNLQRGVQMLQQALSKGSIRHPEPYFELAEAQVALGRKETAQSSYLQALSFDPAFVQAEHHLGNLLADLGKTDQAIQHYRRAIKIDPWFADVHMNLGLTLLGLGDLRATEDAFRQAIAANPMHAPAYRDLGSLFLVQGNFNVAASYLQEALALEPADPKAHHNLGLVLLALGKREEGIAHLEYAMRHGKESDRESTKKILQKVGESTP